MKLNRKKVAFAMVLLCLPIKLNAQQGIAYTYDAAGNRTGSSAILRAQNNAKQQSEEYEMSRMMSSTYQVSVTPNPTRSYVQVRISGLEDGDVCSLSLFDSTGQMVFSEKTRNSQTSIDLTALGIGIYLLRAEFHSNSSRTKGDTNDVIVTKIIKEI